MLAPPKYHPRNGVVIHFDYMLELPNKYSMARIVYGVFKSGMVLTPSRAIPWADVKKKGSEGLDRGFCVFDSK